MIASPEGTNNGSVFVGLLLNSLGQPTEMSGRAITATQTIFYLEVFHIYILDIFTLWDVFLDNICHPICKFSFQ